MERLAISVPQPGRKLEPEKYTSCGVNFFEQPVVLGEAYTKARIKNPAHHGRVF
jgi:hypothetical protein